MELFILKFIRFSIVGVMGMGIDFGVTYLLKEKCDRNKYMANTAGFILAVCFNYTLNRMWTFQSINPAIVKEVFCFIVISVLGLSINTFVLWFGHHKLSFHFYLSKLVAIGVTVLWNFGGNYLITFSGTAVYVN